MFDTRFAKRGWIQSAKGIFAISVSCVSVFCSTALADDFTLPSGMEVSLGEIIVVPPDANILYLGFLAPSLGGQGDKAFDVMAEDMNALCLSIGLAEVDKLKQQDIAIQEVVIRLMDRMVPYGEADQDAVQYLNAYDVREGDCQWV